MLRRWLFTLLAVTCPVLPGSSGAAWADEDADGQVVSAAATSTLPEAPNGTSGTASAPEVGQSISLFDGSTLTGWVVQEGNAAAWSAAEGSILCDRAGGGWLRTETLYSDFELTLEFKLSPGANTGIGFRFPVDRSPDSAGFEVQLVDDAAPKYQSLRAEQRTGSLYYQHPASPLTTLPANEWHALQLRAAGSHVQVLLDEQTVCDVWVEGLPDVRGQPHPLRSRPTRGPIALQSSGNRVEFRNLQVRSLLDPLAEGLQRCDLRAGTGETCAPDAKIKVDYVGRLEDGTLFDSSEQHGGAVEVSLQDAVRGWQLGVPGMQVGGRRKLIVPAALAYGDEGVPNLIPPGATVVFEVELRSVAH